MPLAHADDVVVLLPSQQDFDRVLGVERKVIANQRTASRAERQIVAEAFVPTHGALTVAGGVLFVHAHPDDECVGTGGSIARLVALQTKRPEEFLGEARDCDALLNTYAGPITAAVMATRSSWSRRFAVVAARPESAVEHGGEQPATIGLDRRLRRR